MSRFVPAAIVAVIAVAALAVPASASFDRHFSVITNTTSSHRTSNGFRFTDQFFATFNPNDQVGRDQGHCRETSGKKLKCRVTAHFNGEVGGFGFLRVNGNLGPHDNRLNIVGGTDDFAGVAGKAVLGGAHGNRIHIDLIH
jgi:hypothetical protein